MDRFGFFLVKLDDALARLLFVVNDKVAVLLFFL